MVIMGNFMAHLLTGRSCPDIYGTIIVPFTRAAIPLAGRKKLQTFIRETER